MTIHDMDSLSFYHSQHPEVETPEVQEEVTEAEDIEAEKDEEEEEDEDEDEDDDEDEEEGTDPFDELKEECTKTAACAPYVHHFHECVERVTAEMEEEDYAHKAYKEDCVEEFFHLQHCVNDCAAPKLFYKLK
ncbi:CIC11C00000004645 [Sungouiella intermedia]|uniref:Cytochrome b-c1 complex subunit 6, mitochondrial n=1 Tax=Sungouiella intermedia TaxID=45354 RepID=A0A1L0BBD6_9ASCO|nr:CIC11C00000004645 [[Candida] intermedia]